MSTCKTCNGVLADSLMDVWTPTQMAHAFVHAQSTKDALLAALKACERELSRMTVYRSGDTPSVRLSLDLARIAIAKARGDA